MLTLVLLWSAALVTSVPLHDNVTPRKGEACGYESCTEAEPGVLNVHLVAHTHDDVGWLKTVDQYYYGSRNNIQKAGVQYILDSVVKELWVNPKRKFIYVETAFFWKWWVRQPDSIRHIVHTLVRQGRLQFAGGAWSMNDEAAAHYQSTVDQFTWGLSKLNQTFGPCGLPHVGWQIDPFGHSREFASLLAAMGYDGLFLGRIDYQDKGNRQRLKSMETLWRGDDSLSKSSDIFTGVLHNQYQPPPGFCFDVLCDDEPIIDDTQSPIYNVEDRIAKFLEFVTNQAQYYRTQNVILTMGGDFTYQDATMWYSNLDKLIEYTNLKAAKDGLKIKVFYSTPACYLKAVKDANPTLPTKQDDFFPYASDSTAYWSGYFTSRPTTKYFEREGNSYLQMVKQLQVLAGLEDHNRFVLNELKSAMGVMQHHDAITGTEKQHVTHDYERLLDNAIEDAVLIARQAFNKIIQGDTLKSPLLSFDRCRLNESSCDASETSQQFVVTVYNHLAWNVKEAIRVPVINGQYEVYAPNGQQITSQLVDIPTSVLNIPTRQSKATHEIVFIAHLKPVSIKLFYIKKVNKIAKRDIKYKDTNNLYDLNDYWKRIKDQSYDVMYIEEAELKNAKFNLNTENKGVTVNTRIPDHPMPVNEYEQKYINADNVDLEMLKDREGLSKDVMQLEKIIRDARRLDDVRNAEKAQLILNDEEMRMLGDDPMVVEFPREDFMENEHVKLLIDNVTGEITHAILPDGTDIKFQLQFFYYPGCVGDNSGPGTRSSGAYIFRPNATTPTELPARYIKGPMGPVVQEVRIATENAAANIRVYSGLNYLENDWIVGPVDLSDGMGKEYIIRYMTDIVNNGAFYTDSNGRQMLKRKLNKRAQWNVTLAEPVAGNYYPVTNKIYIEDDKIKIAVLTDRSEGGSSLLEGHVELMIHRRLIHDDAFGVGEALNETANGKGLVVRGRHRVFLSRAGNVDDKIEERKQTLQFHLQPQVFISDAKDLSFEKWMNLTKCHSFANELPAGLHLLTLEPWRGSTLLLRLENYLEIGDRNDTTIEVDLKSIFNSLKVKSFREATLAANYWLDEKEKWVWKKDSDFSGSFNEEYGNFNYVNRERNTNEAKDDGFNIKINAKQIRTFVVDYELV